MNIVDGVLTISTINSQSTRVTINTLDGVDIITTHDTPARFVAAYNGDVKSKVEIHSVRGSIENPEVLQPGDFGVKLNFSTFFEHNGKDIGKSLVALMPQMDPDANPEDVAPASNFGILVNSGKGAGDILDDYMVWAFKKNGALESKILQCVEQDETAIENIEPKNGMMIYNSSTHKFQGFANGTWVNLN